MWQSVLWFLATLYLSILIHELGHLSAVALLRRPISSMSVGIGPRLLSFSWRGMWFRFHMIPVRGQIVLCFMSRYKWKNISIYAAGPIANMICAIAFSGTFFATFSLYLALLNLMPWCKGSDGNLIRKELRA